jgi:hypothetical protein
MLADHRPRLLRVGVGVFGMILALKLMGAHQSGPAIASLNTASGPPATTVTVTGKNFEPTAGYRGSPGGGDDYVGNTVHFGSGVTLKNINSADGMTLKFDVPKDIDAGVYSVTVANSKGVSNSLDFTVTKNLS